MFSPLKDIYYNNICEYGYFISLDILVNMNKFMYINDPNTKLKYKINSEKGSNILKQYIKSFLGGHDGPCAMNLNGRCAKSKIWDKKKCRLTLKKRCAKNRAMKFQKIRDIQKIPKNKINRKHAKSMVKYIKQPKLKKKHEIKSNCAMNSNGRCVRSAEIDNRCEISPKNRCRKITTPKKTLVKAPKRAPKKKHEIKSNCDMNSNGRCVRSVKIDNRCEISPKNRCRKVRTPKKTLVKIPKRAPKKTPRKTPKKTPRKTPKKVPKKKKYHDKNIINIPLKKHTRDKERNYGVKLIKRIGMASSTGEIYQSDIYQNGNLLRKNVAIKIIPTNNNKLEREINIATQMGKDILIHGKKTSIGPKVYYHVITNRNDIIDNVYDKIILLGSRLKKRNFLTIVVMKKLTGRTLFHYAHKKKSLDKSQLRMICRKIKKIHELNYIHNDLHFGNIFIDTKEPYIIDYGLSQFINPHHRNKNNYLRFLKDYPNGNKFYGPHLKNYSKKIYSRNQTCSKASWACERGYQTKKIFTLCKILKLLNKFNMHGNKKVNLNYLDEGLNKKDRNKLITNLKIIRKQLEQSPHAS